MRILYWLLVLLEFFIEDLFLLAECLSYLFIILEKYLIGVLHFHKFILQFILLNLNTLNLLLKILNLNPPRIHLQLLNPNNIIPLTLPINPQLLLIINLNPIKILFNLTHRFLSNSFIISKFSPKCYIFLW